MGEILGGFALASAACLLLLVRANLQLTRRAAKAERASVAKSRFLAMMSHELRTPLGAVASFAELMHDERLGPVSDEHRECLRDILTSAHHALELTDEVLDLARIESGRIALQARPTDPVGEVARCLETCRSLAAERNIAVELEAEPIGTVLLDPARLRQVLLNYLSNAFKFTPDGAQVRVSVARDGDQLVIAVADPGPGIAASDQARVFEQFEQLTSTKGGTGLGLAVTKQIVEAQGGTVGVRSAPGRGSTFYARVPVAAASQVVPRAGGVLIGGAPAPTPGA